MNLCLFFEDTWRGKSAALGMDRNEHLFSRYGEWRRGKSAAIGIT